MEFRLNVMKKTKQKTTAHYKIQGNNSTQMRKAYIGQNNEKTGRWIINTCGNRRGNQTT